MKTLELFDLCQNETTKLQQLTQGIVNCGLSLALVAKEAIKAGKMQHKNPTKTIQITSLCEADLDQLHQLVAEYNARLLWRNAVLKCL